MEMTRDIDLGILGKQEVLCLFNWEYEANEIRDLRVFFYNVEFTDFIEEKYYIQLINEITMYILERVDLEIEV